MRILMVVLTMMFSSLANADLSLDPRWCGVVVRNEDGSIKRSSAVLRAFQIIHPCPVTGSRTGSCPGWSIDHTIALACGGCDDIHNLQWMPVAIKSCKDPYCKDRYERNIIYVPDNVPGLNSKGCNPKLVNE